MQKLSRTGILRITAVFIAVLTALFLVSCKSDNSTGNDNVTSRTITITLKADRSVTYRARFTLDGVTLVSGASPVISGNDAVITVTFDGLTLPKGRHTALATILVAAPSPSQYRMSVGILENGQPAGTGGAEVTAGLGIGGSIEVAFQF